MFLKVILFLCLPWKNPSLDFRLQTSFLFEGSLHYYTIAYTIAGVSWIYGIFVGFLLFESFEIKEFGTKNFKNLKTTFH